MGLAESDEVADARSREHGRLLDGQDHDPPRPRRDGELDQADFCNRRPASRQLRLTRPGTRLGRP
jgi:hypothetical protein